MYKFLATVFLCVLLCLNVFAQTDWVLRNNRDGIKVYSGTVTNSKIKALRVECNFQAGLSQIVAVLLDVKSCTDWVYHTRSCTLLRQVSPSELYYYSEVSLPWPVKNRDFVAHLTVTQDAGTRVVTVDGPAINGMAPPKKDIVRITNSKGKWVITPLEKNEIKVEYTLSVDPAGDLPPWLVNLVSAEGPMQSFRVLKTQLKKPAYRNVSLPFIRN